MKMNINTSYWIGTVFRICMVSSLVIGLSLNVGNVHAAPGAGIYDDSDPSWSYSGTWTSYSVSGAYNDTIKYNNTLLDSASFTFTGSQFILYYTKHPYRGNIDVYVDGNKIATVNANGVYEFQKVYVSPVFAFGSYTVMFENAGGGGGYIDIDAIQILDAAVGAGIYDDDNANWVYNGTSWTTFNGAGPYDNSVHLTNHLGDSAYFAFTGTQFIYKYTKHTNRGNIDVYVDGNKVTTINANGGPLDWQNIYTSPEYPSGTHLVRFRNATGGVNGYIDVDAVQIINAGGSSDPDLTVSKTHSGSGFEQGDTGRTFTIVVTNSGGAPTTGDTVTVVDTLPSELTATAISGTGWSCTLGTLTCTRNDPLDPGLSYPDITLTVDVDDPIEANSLTNIVTVNGGGETNTANNADSDLVNILKPDLVILGYELRNAANDAVITTPLPNEAFYIRMTVKNQGTAASGTFYPSVFLDDQPNYGVDTNPFGRVSDWDGYRRTPFGSISGVGCMYYDPTNSINPLSTAVPTERGNYTRLSNNITLDPGSQDTVDVYIGYPSSESEYQDPPWDPYRNGLPEGSYKVYLYVDPNCSGGKMESNEDNAYGPINIAVTNSPGVGTGVYDDTDSNWSYAGTWTPLSTGVSGAYNATITLNNTLGESAFFNFTGTKFIYKYTQHPNRGNIDVYVDGSKITTINANGTFTYQMTYTSLEYPSGPHLVQFKNATGGANGNIDIDSIEILDTTAPVTTNVTYYSIGANDGWILESSETSGTGGTMDGTATIVNVGDDAADRQYRAILHFNTASLPDTAVITSATLQLRRQGTIGSNPFVILGALRADLRKGSFSAPALQLADFWVTANKNNIATFSTTPVSNWYSGIFSAVGRAYINRTGTTQFRIYFTTDDNDDLGADYVRFFSGNAGITARPRLVIQYHVP